MTVGRQLARPTPDPHLERQSDVVYPPVIQSFGGGQLVVGRPEGLCSVEEVAGREEGPQFLRHGAVGYLDFGSHCVVVVAVVVCIVRAGPASRMARHGRCCCRRRRRRMRTATAAGSFRLQYPLSIQLLQNLLDGETRSIVGIDGRA